MPILVQKAGWFRHLGSNGPVPSYEVEVRPPTLPKLLTLQCVRAVTALLHPRCTASFAGRGIGDLPKELAQNKADLSFNMNALVEKHRDLKESLLARGKGGLWLNMSFVLWFEAFIHSFGLGLLSWQVWMDCQIRFGKMLPVLSMHQRFLDLNKYGMLPICEQSFNFLLILET